MKQNVIIEYKGQKIKVQFEHCPSCYYFEKCYKDGSPHYLDQDCIQGPTIK